jgi:hypothetical protein
MSIPLCWKCANQITEPDVTGLSFKLVGCTESKKVVDYSTAMKHCPICTVNDIDIKQMNTPV